MNDKNKIAFYNLPWDTDYFKISCAKAVLHTSLELEQWSQLKEKFKDYQFVSIQNTNSEPFNARLIGRDTNAFLADVNIQFIKKLENRHIMPEMIKIYQNLNYNKKIIEMSNFQISKFIEDPELKKRGGADVYRHWVINSFNNEEKYFAISKDNNNEINGFLLHSYFNGSCIIELIAVSNTEKNSGIGTNLFKAIEVAAFEHACKEIKVGTQVRNSAAVNFYHKAGCKQVGCHQVYHLWGIQNV
jgi:ribosomal protein S18 acetylase RimI-like enzyme